jgi:PEP-CTERM motif
MNTSSLLSKVRPNVRLFTRVLNIPCAAALVGVVLASTLSLSSPAQAATAKAKPKAAPAANATLASCSWDRPGKNPYMGELPSAVDRYTDLSSDVRTKLKDRIAKQQYDDVVDIKRDTIISSQGKFTYASQIRDMHFGDKGRVCSTVTRTRWKASTTERGYVYCESGQCVMVPTVCRNVSRVVQNKSPAVAADKAAAPAPVAAAAPNGAGPTAAKATPDAPAAAPTFASAGLGPAFADVSQGPVFAFPSGPTGTSSIAIVAPPAGTPAGGGGAGTPGGTTPGGTTPPGVDPGTTVPGGTVPGGTVPGGVVGGVNVVTPIPEPSTYALMLVGLLAVGFAARRRQSNR